MFWSNFWSRKKSRFGAPLYQRYSHSGAALAALTYFWSTSVQSPTIGTGVQLSNHCCMMHVNTQGWQSFCTGRFSRTCFPNRWPSGKSLLLAGRFPDVFSPPAAKRKITSSGLRLAGRVFTTGGQVGNHWIDRTFACRVFTTSGQA